MLILQGVREFVREDHAVLRVFERGVLVHEKFVRVLVVKRGDLLAEQVDVFLAQRIARRQQPDRSHRLGHVLEFLLGKNLREFAGHGLLDLLAAEHLVIDWRLELEPADRHDLSLDFLAQRPVRRERLRPVAPCENFPQPVILRRELLRGFFGKFRADKFRVRIRRIERRHRVHKPRVFLHEQLEFPRRHRLLPLAARCEKNDREHWDNEKSGGEKHAVWRS